MAIATNVVDYLFKVKLQSTLTPQELGPFFARFHAISNLAILFIQLTVLTPILQRFGVKHSFRLYPGFLLTIGSVCFFYAHLWCFTLLRGVDTVMKFTFHQNTENLVMTPVPFLERTQSKVFLKGIIYPLGGLVAGILIFLIDFTSYALFGALVIMLIICSIWLWILHRIHYHYIQQLALNLNLSFIKSSTVKHTKKKLYKQEIKKLREMFQQQEQLSLDDSQKALSSILKLIGYDEYRHIFIDMISDPDKQSNADLSELLDQLLRLEGIYKIENLLDHIFQEHQLAKESNNHI